MGIALIAELECDGCAATTITLTGREAANWVAAARAAKWWIVDPRRPECRTYCPACDIGRAVT